MSHCSSKELARKCLFKTRITQRMNQMLQQVKGSNSYYHNERDRERCRRTHAKQHFLLPLSFLFFEKRNNKYSINRATARESRSSPGRLLVYISVCTVPCSLGILTKSNVKVRRRQKERGIYTVVHQRRVGAQKRKRPKKYIDVFRYTYMHVGIGTIPSEGGKSHSVKLERQGSA